MGGATGVRTRGAATGGGALLGAVGALLVLSLLAVVIPLRHLALAQRVSPEAARVAFLLLYAGIGAIVGLTAAVARRLPAAPLVAGMGVLVAVLWPPLLAVHTPGLPGWSIRTVPLDGGIVAIIVVLAVTAAATRWPSIREVPAGLLAAVRGGREERPGAEALVGVGLFALAMGATPAVTAASALWPAGTLGPMGVMVARFTVWALVGLVLAGVLLVRRRALVPQLVALVLLVLWVVGYLAAITVMPPGRSALVAGELPSFVVATVSPESSHLIALGILAAAVVSGWLARREPSHAVDSDG